MVRACFALLESLIIVFRSRVCFCFRVPCGGALPHCLATPLKNYGNPILFVDSGVGGGRCLPATPTPKMFKCMRSLPFGDATMNSKRPQVDATNVYCKPIPMTAKNEFPLPLFACDFILVCVKLQKTNPGCLDTKRTLLNNTYPTVVMVTNEAA